MINYDELKQFWEYIKPLNKNHYVEIRLTPKFKNWKDKKMYYTKIFYFEKQTGMKFIKGCQLFIQTFEELKKFTSYDNEWFMNNVKVCYALNLRKKIKNGLGEKILAGKYENLPGVRFVFFDIDKKTHTNTTNLEKKLMLVYVQTIINYLKRFNLIHYTLIDSGAGIHLLYKIPSQKVTEARKRWYKHWAKEIMELFRDDFFEVDCLTDFTRIFGLPESMNVKRNKKVKILKIDYNINKFKLKSLKQKKIIINEKFTGSREEAVKKILNEPLVKILLKQKLPDGDRNNVLIFQLKILLKTHNFNENDDFVKQLFNKIQLIQKDIFPSNFPKNNELFFNKKLINKYFLKHNLPIIYEIE